MIPEAKVASTSRTISFPTSTQEIQLPIEPGSVTLVTGPNGVGKSALLATLYRSLPLGVGTYLPGHRQINFNSGWETNSQDPVQLITNLFQHADAFNRYKGSWAEDQFKSTLRTLTNMEAEYNRKFRQNFSLGLYESTEAGSIQLSPIDTLNVVFSGARLPVTFDLTGSGLTAKREHATYPIDAMSDGERAALFIASAVVTLPENAVLLIDEPEKHLHPSIAATLLESSLRARPDASLIISSHDVFLIEKISATHVIHIRNSQVTCVKPEHRIFDASVISVLDQVPDNLRTALLGARSSILFVEGAAKSSDIAIYSHVYDDMKVLPRGGHGKVQEAVKTLQALPDQHWLTVYGLIDGDGRDAVEREKLSSVGIFTLPCPSIENVFFYDAMIDCFIEADFTHSGGETSDQRLIKLNERCYDILVRDKEEIIALRASWILERKLSEAKLSPNKIKSHDGSNININVTEVITVVANEIESYIKNWDWRKTLQKLPIKETGLPDAAAKALGAPSFEKYCSVIARQIETKSTSGIKTLESLKALLPGLHI